MWTVPPVTADDDVTVDGVVRSMVTRREYPRTAGLRSGERAYQAARRRPVRGWWRCLFLPPRYPRG